MTKPSKQSGKHRSHHRSRDRDRVPSGPTSPPRESPALPPAHTSTPSPQSPSDPLRRRRSRRIGSSGTGASSKDGDVALAAALGPDGSEHDGRTTRTSSGARRRRPPQNRLDRKIMSVPLRPSHPKSCDGEPTSAFPRPSRPSSSPDSSTVSSVMSDDLEFELPPLLSPLPPLPPPSVRKGMERRTGSSRAGLVAVGEDDGHAVAASEGGTCDGGHDPVGDALFGILNDPNNAMGRAFRYEINGGSAAASSMSVTENGTAAGGGVVGNVNEQGDAAADLGKDDFHPLLSSYNLVLLRDLFRQSLKFASSLVSDKNGGGGAPPTLIKTLYSTAAFLTLTTAILSAPATLVVLISIRTMLLTLAFAASVLIDYREVELFVTRKSPGWLKELVSVGWKIGTDLTMSVWTLIDWYLLLGRGEHVDRVGDRCRGSKTGGTGIMAHSDATEAHLDALAFCRSASWGKEDKLKARSDRKRSTRSEVGTGTKLRGSIAEKDDARRRKDLQRERQSLAAPTPDGSGIQRSNSWSQTPYTAAKAGKQLEATMPNGDELLRRLIDEDGEEVYSDCFESPMPHVLQRGSLPDDDDDDEAIEVVRQSAKDGDQWNSVNLYSLRANPTVEELLATEKMNDHGHRGYRATSSQEGSSCDWSSSEDHDDRSSVLSGIASHDISYGEQSFDSSSMPSSARSTVAERELNWLDVGAKIGIRLLNNEKVQMAMANPAEAERLFVASQRGGLGSEASGASEAGASAVSPNPTLVASGATHAGVSSPLYGAGSLTASVAPPATAITAIAAGSKPGFSNTKSPQSHLGMIVSPPPKPMHAMWTSPSAAAPRRYSSLDSRFEDADQEDDSRSPDIFASDAARTIDRIIGTPAPTGRKDDEPLGYTMGKCSDRGVALSMASCNDPVLNVQLPTISNKENEDDFLLLENMETGKEEAMDTSLGINRRLPQSIVSNLNVASAIEGRTGVCDGHSGVNVVAPSLVCKIRTQGRTRPRSEVSSLQPPQRRPAMLPGVKMVVPIIPIQPHGHGAGRKSSRRHRYNPSNYQMATVLSSERIYVPIDPQSDLAMDYRPLRLPKSENEAAQALLNCVSITVLLDKSFLRDGKFCEMTLRIMDEWRGDQYMPRHSKFPIGSCVATSFGIGVLVGWRVEDDCHVVRSLWQKRGAGSAMAYLNRGALNGVVEAGIGFKVQTSFGKGEVVAYVNGGTDFLQGQFGVRIKQRIRYADHAVDLSRNDILSCATPKFIPVLEQIKEAAQYQIQLELYELAMRQRYLLENESSPEEKEIWNVFGDGIELMVSSFLKAVSEDQNFDEGMDAFLTTIIDFLEQLDFNNGGKDRKPLVETDDSYVDDGGSAIFVAPSEQVVAGKENVNAKEPSSGFFEDIFGGMFKKAEEKTSLDTSTVVTDFSVQSDIDALIAKRTSKTYNKIYAFIRTMLRTLAIARASVPDRPNLQMGLTTVHEILLFVRTAIKVQQTNMSPDSVKAWKRTFKEFVSTFGPIQERIVKLSTKIAERLEKHGKKAKHRMLRFVDIVLADEHFLQALEMLDWPLCIYRLEHAAVRAKIIDAESCAQYHKTALFLFSLLAPRAGGSEGAAARNEEKLANLAKALKLMASPHRTLLKLLMRDDVQELLERLLVRVFQKDAEASQMLNIIAFNFHSFRDLRMLKDMSISGRLWRPCLDAADEEFSSAVAQIPDNAKVFIEPVSKLFSLGVAGFHSIRSGDLNADWLDFLVEKEAVKIIQELDRKLILSLEGLCKDVNEAMEVMPYYSSIDDDILNLIDEVEIKTFLKETAEALVDADRFALFLRDKITVAVTRFLDYLPKMSIPIERRELGEGWVLTCRGRHGDDLRLSDVIVKQDDLTCEILGGENILSPVLQEKLQSQKGKGDPPPLYGSASSMDEDANDVESVQISVLNDVADLIRNAQQHGCWKSGKGGVGEIKNDVDPALKGLPVSEVLRCAIDLWQNMDIDDEELMEIAIRDVSYQIALQNDVAEDGKEVEKRSDESSWRETTAMQVQQTDSAQSDMSSNLEQNTSSPQPYFRRRFNPRKDPTLLNLEMKKMTCHLDEFLFRIEPMERSTIFDPVFEGLGSLTIKHASIKVRLECRKERMNKLETEVFVPVLQLQGPCDIALEQVKFRFKETGADWLLNNIVKGFRDIISEVVESKVKEQIVTQIEEALDNLNAYLGVNPDLLLTILGITIDDLEENVVFV